MKIIAFGGLLFSDFGDYNKKKKRGNEMVSGLEGRIRKMAHKGKMEIKNMNEFNEEERQNWMNVLDKLSKEGVVEWFVGWRPKLETWHSLETGK